MRSNRMTERERKREREREGESEWITLEHLFDIKTYARLELSWRGSALQEISHSISSFAKSARFCGQATFLFHADTGTSKRVLKRVIAAVTLSETPECLSQQRPGQRRRKLIRDQFRVCEILFRIRQKSKNLFVPPTPNFFFEKENHFKSSQSLQLRKIASESFVSSMCI